MADISSLIIGIIDIPAVQIAIGVLTTTYGILRVVGATSIGKKSLNELKSKFSIAENYRKSIEKEHKEIVEQKDKQFNALKGEYEAKLNYLEKYTQDKLTALKTALLKINNEQVRKVVEDIDLNVPNVSFNDEIERVKQETKEQYEQKLEDVLQRLEVLEHGKEEPNN